MQQDPEPLDLARVAGVLRRQGMLIAMSIVLVAAGALALSRLEAKKYAASASVAFEVNPLNEQIAGLSTSSGSTLAAQQSSNVQLLTLGDMAAKTAAQLGHGLSAQEVADSVTVTGAGESTVAAVRATADRPDLAAAIANTYARDFVREQQDAHSQYFRSALALVRRQLSRLTPRQQADGAGVALQERAQTLALLAALNYGNVQLAQAAAAASAPLSSKTSRNTVLGAFLGLLIGFAIAFLREGLDPRVRRAQELESIYRTPLLGTVGKITPLTRTREARDTDRAPDRASTTHALDLIRAHLRAYSASRDVRTLLIASAARGDGASTIARGLAEAATRAGSRALLVETDVPDPKLAGQLDPPAREGLAEVLNGTISIEEAIRPLALRTPSVGGHVLDVLCAGGLSANATELLESDAMDTLLEQARSTHELVVIDAPALTDAPGTVGLLRKVDGVVIVARIGRSRRDAAEQLREVLARSGAVLLGAIANGSSSREAHTRTYRQSRSLEETATAEAGAASGEPVPAGGA